MSKKDLFSMEGKIVKCLPNKQFRVELSNNHEVLCYLKGLLKKKRIQFILGDVVKIEMSSYDLDRGRITKRISK